MRSLIGLVVLVLLVAACGNAAEELTERAIEAGGGGNADVELDLDDEGQGEVVVETEDGTQTMNFGSGELPDELEIPVPDGYEVVASSVLEQGDEQIVTASLTYPGGDIDEIVAHFDDWYEDLDGVNKSENSFDDGRQVVWFTQTPVRNVSVMGRAGEGSVEVTVSQQD